MCGRYSLSRPTRQLAELFDAREATALRERYTPSFNIAPTREVVGLALSGQGDRVLDLYRWGLVPSWARNPSIGGRLFNARAEGLATRPAFGPALAARRMALIADGFFEWLDPGHGRRRQPLFFQRADRRPLALAGLWESWADPSPRPAPTLLTCSMITTVAGPDLAEVHDRMPVLLDGETLEAWLDPSVGGTDELEGLLRPAPAGTLVHHPVDPRVGDVHNDEPALVAPFEPEAAGAQAAAEPLRLFH